VVKLHRRRVVNIKRRRVVNLAGKSTDTTITRLLEDPIAKGIRRANYTESTGDKKQWKLKNKSEWVFNEAPAIITEEEWDKINLILTEQSKDRKQPLNKKTHLFTGFVTCSCGNKMYLPSNNPKYTCNNCKNKINQDDLEEIFHQQLTDYIISEENIKHYINASESVITEKEKLLITLQKEAQKIQTRLDNLIELHLNKELATDGFRNHYNPPFEQLQQIQAQIPLLEGEMLALRQNEESSKYLFSEAQNLYSKWHNFSREEKRNIIESITDSIIIDNEDIIINLKYLMPPSSINPTDGQHNFKDSLRRQA